MSDLILYEKQHAVLVENTQRLLQGRNAGNILLYGDKGTGKSASVKALLNDYWQQGLRIVEVRPQCLTDLPEIFVLLRGQPVDCAFVPLDPRQEDDYARGLLYALKALAPKTVFPMHYWGRPEIIGRFLREYPQYEDYVNYTEQYKEGNPYEL